MKYLPEVEALFQDCRVTKVKTIDPNICGAAYFELLFIGTLISKAIWKSSFQKFYFDKQVQVVHANEYRVSLAEKASRQLHSWKCTKHKQQLYERQRCKFWPLHLYHINNLSKASNGTNSQQIWPLPHSCVIFAACTLLQSELHDAECRGVPNDPVNRQVRSTSCTQSFRQTHSTTVPISSQQDYTEIGVQLSMPMLVLSLSWHT